MEFFSKWIEGIKNLSPAQQFHAKLIGNYGQLIGMILAFAVMLWKGYWYFSIFMVFALFLQVIILIGARQEYLNYCKMIEEVKNGH